MTIQMKAIEQYFPVMPFHFHFFQVENLENLENCEITLTLLRG